MKPHDSESPRAVAARCDRASRRATFVPVLLAGLLLVALTAVNSSAGTVYWSGPGGDMWNTNSSPYTVDTASPFDIIWSSNSLEGDFIRPSGLALVDIGSSNLPFLFGSTGWSPNRVYRRSAQNGAYTTWVAQNGLNDSGSGFRVAVSNGGARVYHLDLGNVLRAYPTETDPAGVPLWSKSTSTTTRPLANGLKVGPDGRIYGHSSGAAAYDSSTGALVWWSAANPENAVMPGAFWWQGTGYRYIVAGRTTSVCAYNIASAAGSSPVWSFVDTETGYAPPTVDPSTGSVYAFRSTRVLKLNASGQLAWRSAQVGTGEFGRSYGALSRDGATFYYQTGTATNTGKLYAFNTSDGTIKWSYATGAYARDYIGGPVVSANGVVFCPNAAQSPGDNRIFCIQDAGPGTPVLRGTFDMRDEGDVGAPWITLGPGGYAYFDGWATPNNTSLFACRTRETQALLPAPTGLAATPYRTTVSLSWSDSLPSPAVNFVVYRRAVGDSFPSLPTKFVGRRAAFTDFGLQPGTTYQYRVATCDLQGVQLSQFAGAFATTRVDSTGLSKHASKEILIAFYTGGYTAEQVSAMTEGLKRGMEYYWRTTNGRLTIQPTWLYIDAPLPGTNWYAAAVTNDLYARGIRDGQYDLAYLVGNGLDGCLGGYLVFGSTCASLGTVCGGVYPENTAGVNYTITWTFTHEIHHAFELMRSRFTSAAAPVLTCHFPWAYPTYLGATGKHLDMAADFDGIAGLNRDYGNDWSLFGSPYGGTIECVDADGDGLPDADSRVWMDEARFGSSPTNADTDGDGLGDLAEYARYNFRGTDPLDPDTDHDGFPDGIDPEPLYACPTGITRFPAPPVIDGVAEPGWPRLATGYYFSKNTTPFSLQSYAGWDTSGLYLAFESSRQLRFKVSIDGSGQDGRWESPVRHAEGATDTNNQDNKGAQIGDSWGDGYHVAFAYGSPGAVVFNRGSIAGAVVASSAHDGSYRTEIKIPRVLRGGAPYTWYPAGTGTPVVDGLTLAAGQVIGLNVTCSNIEDSDDSEFSGTYTNVFETFSYVDFELLGGVTAVDGGPRPGMPTPGLYFANPYRAGGAIVLRLPALASGAVSGGTGVTAAAIDVYDVIGRKVRALYRGPFHGGENTLRWDGRADSGAPVNPGVYFVRAATDQHAWQRKLVVVR